jgi:mono/diheme cytochrome c family protein
MIHLPHLKSFGRRACLALLTLMPAAGFAQSGPTEGINKIYDLAVAPLAGDPEAVLIATDYGLLRADSAGISHVLPGLNVAVTGLAVAADAPQNLFVSGFDVDGKPVGIIASTDGGATWTAPAPDAGNLAVMSLSVAAGKPLRMAGLDEQIRLSDDGGASWTAVAETPEQTFAVALSATQPDRIYAATMGGLLVSEDAGASWASSTAPAGPATALATLNDGRMAAFIHNVGFAVSDVAEGNWDVVGSGFADRYLTSIAQAPNGDIYAAADTGAILLSRDGGRNWISYEGSDTATPARIAAGKALFADTCQACHGVAGIGEAPGDPSAKDEFGFKAPALNNDAHAWHHSDAGLRETIHKGSPRNERMIAWEEQMSDDDIDSILAYVKSTWSVRSLACQGARHMTCMGQ